MTDVPKMSEKKPEALCSSGKWAAFKVQIFDKLDKSDPKQRWIFS